MPRAPIAADKRKTAESMLGAGKSINEVAKTVGIGVATAAKIKAELPANEAHLAHIAPQLRPLAKPIGELHNDPANARKHPDRNIDAIKASLARFGQRKPIVARPVNGKLIVVAGNGTLDSAKALGWTHLAASVQEMTDAEATAYAIADNRTAELAEWDDDTLAKLLGGLEPDMQAVAGFDETEIADLLASVAGGTEGLTDPDAVPEQPPAITQRGDLWVMGAHRLICGDSTNAVDVNRVMDGEKAFLLSTDPPYGVDFSGAKYNPRAKEWDGIENDKLQGVDLEDFITLILNAWLPFISKQAGFYFWTAAMQEGAAAAAVRKSGLHIQSQIIWNKNALVLGQADYHWKHENCWYAFWKGEQHRWFGERDKTTVWEVSKVAHAAYVHPMQKPTELYEIPMTHHTKPGEIVAEPFSGSGSQIIAAEKLGRRCYAIEIEPRYVDVAVQRWCEFTGKDATRESDGAKWSDLSKKATNG